ncbi:peptidase M16 domain-containing protein [Chitinispirillum alkaliphilum]|nr:peptidase M16 domain-containing protein [Chitinispirillum alkaliphilum]
MNFKFTFPPMQEKVLENGLRVIFVPDRTRDGVVVAFQTPVGRYSDPLGLEGVTDIAAGLIMKGSAAVSSEKFSDEFEYRGASVAANVGEEHTVFVCRMLSRFLYDLFPLFWDALSNPALNEKEFGRLKKEALTALQAEMVDPSFLANRHFYSQLAGKEHPAGRFHGESSIKNLSVQDLRNYYSNNFSPNGALLVIGGNFDPEQFDQKFSSLLSTWSAVRKTEPVTAPAVETVEPALRFIDKKDLSQTTIMMGHAFPGENSPHRSALAVANYILGAGNFSSRLMTRIRSKHGQTYGIASQVSSDHVFGAFYITTSTQNSSVEEVVKSVMEEYGEFCSSGVTAEELEKARAFATGNLSFQLEGINNIVDKLLWLRLYGLENSYIENYRERINSLELDYINKVIKEFFNPGLPVLVCVGKKGEVLEKVSRLGYTVKQYSYREKI